MVRYLGIDISLSHTALVSLNEHSNNPLTIIPQLGYSLDEHSTMEEQAKRVKIITDGIIGFINGNPRSRTAIEGYSYGSKGSSVLQIAELGGVLRYRILDENTFLDKIIESYKSTPLIPGERSHLPPRWELPHFVPPTSLKLFATGKGNSSKADVAVGCFRKWGFDYQNDDNVIDAYVLAQMVKHCDQTNTTERLKMFNYQIDALENCGMLDPSDPLLLR